MSSLVEELHYMFVYGKQINVSFVYLFCSALYIFTFLNKFIFVVVASRLMKRRSLI